MLLNHVVLGVCWVVYGLLHSFLAAAGTKEFFKKKLEDHYRHYRLYYTLFAAAALAAVIWYGLSIESVMLFLPNVFTDVAGGSITTFGACIMYVCVKKYFMGLSGIKSLLQAESHASLIVTGVHRHVRHPLYLGTFLFIWGLFLLFPSASFLLSNVIITGYTLLGIKLEEQKLVKQFGEQYTTYQKKVPKLIPKF